SSFCASSTGRGQAPKEPWLRKSIRGSSVQCRAKSLATSGLGRELIDVNDLGEAESDEERAQRLPRRFAGPFLQTLVRADLRLEGVPCPLEELRRLLRAQVRADDLDLRGAKLHLRLHPRQHHLDPPAFHAQRVDVELAQVEAEVRH